MLVFVMKIFSQKETAGDNNRQVYMPRVCSSPVTIEKVKILREHAS